MVLREMHSALASRIYTNGAQQSASGAVFPDAPSSIPNIGAEFLGFTPKSVEVWPNLPACIRGTRGDTERARRTDTTPSSTTCSARRAPTGASWQASTADPEALHRAGVIAPFPSPMPPVAHAECL